MFYIVMAIIGELSFTAVNIILKRLRNRGAQTLAVMAAYGLLAPLWIAAALYFILQGRIDFTGPYMLVVGLWFMVCYLLNFGSQYLARFQSLSDGTGYKFGAITLWALLADILIFKHQFSGLTVIVLLLLFSGGTVLHFAREKSVGQGLRMPLSKRLPAILILSLIETSTYFLFKQGALMQESILAHNAFLQALIFSVFLVTGLKALRQDRHAGHIPTFYILILLPVMLVACVADGFAMVGLPLTLFVMFPLLRAIIFAVHDIITGELPFTRLTVAAILLIVTGLGLMVTLKQI